MNQSLVKPVRIAIVVPTGGPGMVPLGLAELLRKSAQLQSRLPTKRKPRELSVAFVGATRTVTVADGYRLACDKTFHDEGRYDLVLMPAVDASELGKISHNRHALEWLRRAHERGSDVASVCTGAFVLAEAGLLDNRRATTHWAFQDLFAQRFPCVRLEPQAIVVDEGRICTAGGATSFITLALYLVEKLLGAETARAASSMYLIDVNKAPQGAYAIFSSQKLHGDESVLEAQAHIEGELGRAESLEQLAKRVGLSPRTLFRRFKQATGNTPSEYLQRARVEAAKRSLVTSAETLAVVAESVGYSDVVGFRKVFRRHTGLTPADCRRRYAPFASTSLVKAARR